MTKVKKVVTAVLLLLLTLNVCACGKGDIIGTWRGKIELTDKINARVEAAIDSLGIFSGTDVQLPVLADYLTEVKIIFVYTFNEDGTYSLAVDEASLNTSLDSLKSALYDFVGDAMFHMLAYTCVQMGLAESVNTPEELEAVMGVSMDEAMTEGLGMSLEDFVNGLVDSSLDVEAMKGVVDNQGKYEAEDGKLYMSQGTEDPVFPEIYNLYTVNGSIMTITAGPAGLASDIKEFYPLILERVA